MKELSRQLFLIGYHEIGLKGKNRSHFVDLFLRNIVRQANIKPDQITHFQKRVYMDVQDDADIPSLVNRLKKVFGIKWFALADEVGFNFEGLLRVAVKRANRHAARGDKTFKVETRRSYKEYQKRSQDINNELGEAIRTQSDLEVDVHAPDVIFNVEVRKKGIFLYTDRHEGPGGLPVGSSGKVLTLFSGGIDSPVVVWTLMKRGLTSDLIYFHSPPYTGEKVLQKIKSAAEVLQQWSGEEINLYVVPFTKIQEEIADRIPDRYWTLFHRRFMMRIASILAEEKGYGALATGDSLGQVASQTLSNLSVIDQASDKLVLRPLVGMNKQEIIRMAKMIDTFEISIQPYEDCCVLFAPKQPATQSDLNKILKLEKRLAVEQLTNGIPDKVQEYSVDRQAVEI